LRQIALTTCLADIIRALIIERQGGTSTPAFFYFDLQVIKRFFIMIVIDVL